MIIFLICLFVWVVGGLAIPIIDFFTTRYLFYAGQLRITSMEYCAAGLLGCVMMTILWVMAYKSMPKP